MRLFRHSSITQTLIVFLISIFTCSSIFLSTLPTPSHAEIDMETLKTFVGDSKGVDDYLNEFCQKRSGELMNLETWFSGKCGKDVDTLSGEGVGFFDIVFLQLLEVTTNPQYKSSLEKLQEFIDGMTKISAVYYDNNTPIIDKPKIIADLKQSSTENNIVNQLENISTKIINTRPASSIDYVKYVASNLKKNHIVSDTFAASPGYGFQALSPILPLWRAFRNIAYILFALAFVIYGMMIMFRVRIDSKTAATIQLAIPKLITTLLMITFSYAIAGFLIDLSTIMTALSIDVLRVGGIIDTPSTAINLVSGQSFGAVGSFFVNTIVSWFVTPWIVFNTIVGGGTGAATTAISFVLNMWTGRTFYFLVNLIMFFAVLISYVKLIIQLFKSYFSVIVNIIFSPIMLLGEVFPGQKSFSKWIMGLIANLAVFPTAAFFLVLSYALMMQPIVQLVNTKLPVVGALHSGSFAGIVDLGSKFNTIWTPNMTTLVENQIGSLTIALIGLGLLLMASKYVDMVLKALNVEAFPYGAAIGDALKSGYGAAKNIIDNSPAAGPKMTQLKKDMKTMDTVKNTVSSI